MSTCRERLIVHFAQDREMAQVATVVPGSAGPVHRHLPNVHHTHRHDLIHVALQAKATESGRLMDLHIPFALSVAVRCARWADCLG